ncbi:hypothetical protein PV390_07160 [Streptomyces sp. ME02-6991-2A]|uniref:hypothetical protein n=1 Tax=Streptomyces sp. ME02-6991-2A TaxID=3028677 RepID=UPI0029B02426|nr:hypothetical protein [Streptomyces sp. ME02-6991-2A]MDX3374185.1 hypothetical protein [Streptomyces sp. ME02-6991-2A]
MTTEPSMLQVALSGFHAARVRYFNMLDEGHPEEHLIIPAVEATYWACVLDERLEKEDSVYESSQEYGRGIMLGTRFARNRATHQLPMLIRKIPGIIAPIRAPIRVEEMVWMPVKDLPEGRPAPRQQTHYEAHLASKPVRHTIDQIADWFASEQNRPGSLMPTVS